MASFENLRIQRLIVHEVVLATALNSGEHPLMSQTLTQLDDIGLLLVARRLAEALGSESQSIKVDIRDTAEGSAFQLATSLFEASDEAFIAASQQLAMKLSRAQNIGSIKSGVAVILQGTSGPDANPQRLAIVVKAESDSAFIKRNLQRGVTLEFVKEMVFGAQQRLFKIGAFLERGRSDDEAGQAMPADFDVVVYDHQLNIKGEGKAAQYFYSTFLGATTADSVPQLNKRFFEATGRFIADAARTPEDKSALRGDLISYFRSNSQTISGREFADQYLRDMEERQRYLGFLREAGFPRRAVPKDTRFFAHQLKHRRLTFSNRVHVSAPAEGFRDAVQIIAREAQSTTLRIAGSLVDDT